MSTLIAIDPGCEAKADRVCYCAEFQGGELYDLHQLTWQEAQRRATVLELEPDTVVIEKPQQDGRSRVVPPKILIDLAWNGALCAMALCPTKLVELEPRAWKAGNKHAHQLKAWRALKPAERKHFPADTEATLRAAAVKYVRTRKITKHHSYNTLDAVALGLFFLGRIRIGGSPR